MTLGSRVVSALFALSLFLLPASAFDKEWDFENYRVGSVPDGWSVVATNADSLPSWRIIKVSGAPSGSHVLEMARPAVAGGPFGIGMVFNVCFNTEISLKNLKATVKFKPVRGEEDQGGGVIWRVKDKDNYYIARYNPLEENFRYYYVKDGRRFLIKGVPLRLEKGLWHTITILQQDEKFEAYVDGRKLFDARDWHIRDVGNVGLWTKADAVTMFDDFRVEKLKGED